MRKRFWFRAFILRHKWKGLFMFYICWIRILMKCWSALLFRCTKQRAHFKHGTLRRSQQKIKKWWCFNSTHFQAFFVSRVDLIHLFLALNFYCHFFFISCQIHFRFLFNGFQFFSRISASGPLTMSDHKPRPIPKRRTTIQTTPNFRLTVKYFTSFFYSFSRTEKTLL